MKIVVGNLTSTLETDNPKIISALREKYSFSVPGHEYSQAYKKEGGTGRKDTLGLTESLELVFYKGCIKILKVLGSRILNGRINQKKKNSFYLRWEILSIETIKKKRYTDA